MRRIFYVVAILALAGCKLFSPKVQPPPPDTVYQETIILTRPNKPDTTIAKTLIKWDTMTVDSPYYVLDTTSQALLKIVRDKYNRLLAECVSQPVPSTDSTILQRRKEIKHVPCPECPECPPCEQEERGVAQWLLYVAFAAGFGLCFLIFKLFR